MRNAQFEFEKRLSDLEKQSQLLGRDLTLQTDQLKSLVTLNMSQKQEQIRELDNLGHSLSQKADILKVQELVGSLKTELVSQLSGIKKDMGTSAKKKEQDLKIKV